MKLILAKTSRVGSVLIACALSVGSLCAEKILYLGDSLSMGSFGRTMDSQMRAAGHEVFTYVTGGATPYYWLSIYDVQKTTIGQWEKTPERETRKKTATVPKLEDLLQKHWPDIVVVQTGVNLYAQLRSKQRTKKENIREVTMLVRNMGETIKSAGAQCFWITPPDSHSARYPRELQDEMFQIMKLAASRYGPVFNSQDVTTYTDPYPRNDGIHYGSKEANAWGNLVAEEVNAWLSERGGQPARRPLMAAFRAKQLDGPGLASFAGIDTAIPGVELGKDATPVAALVRDEEGVPKGKSSIAGDPKVAASMKKTEDAIAAAKSLAMESAKAERIRKDALEMEAKKKAEEAARVEALALATKEKKELEKAARVKALELAAAEKKAKAEAAKKAAELALAEKKAKAEQLARIAAKEKEEAAAEMEAKKLAKEKLIAAAEARREAEANAAAKMAEEKKSKAEAEKRIAALAAAEKNIKAKAAVKERIAALAAEKEVLEKAAAKKRIAKLDAVEKDKVEKAEEQKKVVSAKEAPAPDVFKVKRAKSSTAPSDEVNVDIKLVGISKTPAKNQINYGKALAIYEWEVTKVNAGTYTPKTIRIAHTVYWNGKSTSAAKWEAGRTWSLDLKVLSAYPQVEQWQTFDDLDINTELPVYLPKM